MSQESEGYTHVPWSTSSEVYVSGALDGPAQDSPEATTLLMSEKFK